MGIADLHIHTVHSYDGTCSVSAVLKYVADRTDLDVIAITDHDTLAGVQEALDLAPRYGVEVIPGCEVSTADGHLLALFINRSVKAGMTLADTARCVGDLGGLCIAAHPLARGTSSLRFETIREALRQPGVADVLVGIEAFNGGLVYTRCNPIVEANSRALPLAQVGNSDAHVLQTIGQGATLFLGNTAVDLRNALQSASTKVRKGHNLNGFEVIRSYIPHFLLRNLGWVAYNANPQAPLTFARLSRAMGNRTTL